MQHVRISPPVIIFLLLQHFKVKQSHYRPGKPWGFQETEAPRFQDSPHMKAAFTRSPLPQQNIFGTSLF